MKNLFQGKSIFNLFERKFNFSVETLNFRFPIETLDKLLKDFFRNHKQSAFLIQCNGNIPNLALKKISDSYLLKLPLKSLTNEHVYVGLSDLLCFLVLFDEPEVQKQNFTEQKSRFFLSFDPVIVNEVLNYFYKNHCSSMSIKEKRLLIKLKNFKIKEIDTYYVSKFQEALLVSALNENNKFKNNKVIEAISFTDESIVITDLSGEIIEANKNFYKFFCKNKNVHSVREIISVELLQEALRQSSIERKWQSEIKLQAATNKDELFQVSCSLFKDDLNRPNGFVFTFKDITELKRLDQLNKSLISRLREKNAELTEINKRLISADRIKTDLLSVVSHELKTPVSSIMGFSELISQREYDKETLKGFVDQIHTSAKKLDGLVTDYLDLVCNQLTIPSELPTMPVNVADLIRLCYKEEKTKFVEAKFDFELSSIGFDPVVISEANNLQRLFSNLFNNAMKYSPQGGKISVKLLNDGERVTISIADQGVGLTIDQAKQVFDPFYRTDNSVTREFPGIGLGLAVCKKIVEIYGGSIWCESGVDVGTVFYVILPVNPNKIQTEQKVNIEQNKIFHREEIQVKDRR